MQLCNLPRGAHGKAINPGQEIHLSWDFRKIYRKSLSQARIPKTGKLLWVLAGAQYFANIPRQIEFLSRKLLCRVHSTASYKATPRYCTPIVILSQNVDRCCIRGVHCSIVHDAHFHVRCDSYRWPLLSRPNL